MRMRGGVRRFQTGGANIPVTGLPATGLAGVAPGAGGMTPGGGQGMSPQMMQALAQMRASGGGGMPGGGMPLGMLGGGMPGGGMPPGAMAGGGGGGALMGAGGAGMTPAVMNQMRSVGQAPAVGGVNPVLPAGGPGGAAFGPQAAGTPGIGAASTGGGLNPVAIQQAAAARAATGGMARGGRVRAPSGRVHGGGGPGHQPDAQFGVSGPAAPSPKQAQARVSTEKRERGVPLPGMARGGKVKVRPSRVAAAARRAEEEGRARGGKVKVRPSRVAAAARRAEEEQMARGGRVRAPSGRVHGGGGVGHQADTQFGVSGGRPPSPKTPEARSLARVKERSGHESLPPSRNRRDRRLEGMADGGRVREPSGQIRGGGGPGHQPDQQFGVNGQRPPRPTQPAARARGGSIGRGGGARGRGAIVSPEDRDQNLNPALHGARQWGDTMRAAEDLPLAPPPSRRAVIRRRPLPVPTPPPYNEGVDNPVPYPMAKGGKWIQGAIKRPGALRRALGVKGDQTIPAAKLAKAAKVPGRLGRQARMAKTLRKLNKRKGGACPPDKMARGGACPPGKKKMAAGGVAKVRRGFPNTNPKPGPQATKQMQRGGTVRVRGAGAAERGTQFKGVF